MWFKQHILSPLKVRETSPNKIRFTTSLLLLLSISVHGGLSEWSTWMECSVTCEGGEQTRFRNCDNPQPSNGGQFCVGTFNQTRLCAVKKCPSKLKNNLWSQINSSLI